MKNLPQRIRERRKLKMMTQEELAKKSGVSQTTISAYENEEDRQYRYDIVWKIAAALEASPEYLMRGQGPEEMADVHHTHADLMAAIQALSADQIDLLTTIARQMK